MTYRGRLIWPMKATLAPLDVAAVEATADHVFGDVPERVEVAPASYIQVSVQVETEDALDGGRQRLRPTGNDPKVELRLVVHYEELEDLGLVDAQGGHTIPVNHRLHALHNRDDELIREYPPASSLKALYCVEPDKDASFGLSGGTRNLLLLEYSTRDEGTNRVS